MIIRELQITDFGAYSGRQVFNLAPVEVGSFSRPVVLVRGKNGVGKSTVLEAVRLCLHGMLALGHSISRATYEEHLTSRIHRSLKAEETPQGSSIHVSFDYVVLGRKRHYEVHRGWRRKATNVTESLDVWENGTHLSDLSSEQKEALLRELVPPGVTEVFLFDSEKLHTLAADGTSNNLLREMVTSLLGLDLVARLQRDMDVYLSRQGPGVDRDAENDYAKALSDAAVLGEEVSRLHALLQEKETELAGNREAILQQERRIASDGGAYAEQYASLKGSQELLRVDSSRQRIVIQEMTSGLMPFAICPKMCSLVAQRLETEDEYLRVQSAAEISSTLLESVAQRLSSDEFWNAAGLSVSQTERIQLVDQLRQELETQLPGSSLSSPLLLHASDRDRATLLEWMETARDAIPREFCCAVAALRATEDELAQAEGQLARVPAEEILEPLVRNLHALNERTTRLLAEHRDLEEQRRRLEYEHQQAQWVVESSRQKMIDQGKGQTRIELVGKTQSVLKDYGDVLLRHKLESLERALAERFSELCRKPAFAERMVIDPQTFAITLYRRGRVFSRSDLSAGEKQLLATAVIWALRDVSRLPIPVFVDTPVARLDVDHRDAMVGSFLPRVSHQTVLFMTDAELDEETLEQLSPLLARRYELEYQDDTGTTLVCEYGQSVIEPANLSLELVL